MNIDFEKLILLVLPIRIRNGVKYIVKAIASAIQNLYDEYQLWQIDMRLQAQMTCQVMYLELILNYRLLHTFTRTIFITDGDGVTVDFIVNVPAAVQVDANQMIGLIEKYKTYGKRYTIGQSQYTYEVNWSDFVCEKVLMSYEAHWSGFVCEQTYVDEIRDNIISAETVDLMIHVTSSEPVASNVMVRIRFVLAGNTHDYDMYLNTGQSSAWLEINEPIQDLQILEILPSEDAIFRYIHN